MSEISSIAVYDMWRSGRPGALRGFPNGHVLSLSGTYNGAEHTPKLMPCSHTVCLECLSRIVTSNTREPGERERPGRLVEGHGTAGGEARWGRWRGAAGGWGTVILVERHGAAGGGARCSGWRGTVRLVEGHGETGGGARCGSRIAWPVLTCRGDRSRRRLRPETAAVVGDGRSRKQTRHGRESDGPSQPAPPGPLSVPAVRFVCRHVTAQRRPLSLHSALFYRGYV